jgi:putative oxidoreductase
MEQQRTRSAESVVIMILTVLLAAVFATTGVAKLIGTEPIGLQAAAMRGFPGWIRVLVGIAEIGGAVALFIPAAAAFGAAMLAFLMVPATITQVISGEPGALVPVVLGIVLLIVAWRRAPGMVRAGYDHAFNTPRPLLREGVILGVIGATIIAVWFFAVDFIGGRPLFTPATLGRGLLRIFGPVTENPNTAFLVFSYTVVHYAAFVVLGLIASLIVNVAQREPSILLGFVVLFAATEVGFYALAGLLQQASPLGTLAWYNVMAGNLLAAIGMGAYLWRTHPALREQFRHAIDGSRQFAAKQ